MNNNLWNILTSIKNGQLAKKKTIVVPRQTLSENLLKVLWDEGYILGYKIKTLNTIKIFLKYKKTGAPAINILRTVSKPSQKVYLTISQIWKFDFSNSLGIFSTSKGLKSAQQCKLIKTGGELLVLIS